MTKKTAKKVNSKSVRQQKQKRRRWITFVRMVRYGINNFSRNAWLTIAATAVMTITLLIIFSTFIAQSVLTSTIDTISKKVNISIYLKTDTEYSQVSEVISQIEGLENTRAVRFTSSEEARKSIIDENKKDRDFIDAVAESNNRLPATINVELKKLEKTEELQNFVASSQALQERIDPKREPSYAGKRRAAIDNIGQAVVFAQRVGYAASGLFVAISSLIVFNTIRMAIFSRKEEISMMKLIGADRSFIRGPFVVEAIVYGFIAALFATGIGYGGLYLLSEKVESYGVAVEPTMQFITTYIGFIVLIMIVIGALIGTISSFFATHRYLKIDKL